MVVVRLMVNGDDDEDDDDDEEMPQGNHYFIKIKL